MAVIESGYVESQEASRRRFMQSLGALGVASLFPAGTAVSQPAAPKLIDTHHHFYAPAYQKA